MIIDGQAQFRTLLMHHLTTHWSDAIISAYDPTEAGHLPDEFSGAGNDLILLGSSHGERDGVDVLRRFVKRENFRLDVMLFQNRLQSDCFSLVFRLDQIFHRFTREYMIKEGR